MSNLYISASTITHCTNCQVEGLGLQIHVWVIVGHASMSLCLPLYLILLELLILHISLQSLTVHTLDLENRRKQNCLHLRSTYWILVYFLCWFFLSLF